jgi:O-acetyl-ADP-ribose deacetylase (regulator of RNase III)
MSKAFFKSSVAPELCYKSAMNKFRSIEVWLTTCIVTNFGGCANCSVLVNPCNPQLTGCANFPYFPKGGPVPIEKPISMHKDWQPLGFVSQWGGMEVGGGMLYPASVVDGLVHQYGGWKLQAECKLKRLIAGSNDVCPVGSAVITMSGGLQDEYEAIVHTPPPFYKFDEEPEYFLSKCYQCAFETAFAANYSRIATPLLGAGERGFPEDVAIRIAANASLQWYQDDRDPAVLATNNGEQVIAFGLLERHLVDDLVNALSKETNE